MSATESRIALPEAWPELPLSAWADTYATLHMWTQIVGKVRLALCPHENHWWEVPLYVTARGLTTSPISYAKGIFEIEFDFIHHQLDVITSGGESGSIPMKPRSVADFLAELMALLASLGIAVKIWNMPVEIPDPIRFDRDTIHAAYDPHYANAFWKILVIVDGIFKEFRSRFIGKVSPVHFFWGSFDLAVTRFSGRIAPERPGADRITRDAYSHEVSSVGFWPGGGGVDGAAFYSYAAPAPAGFAERPVRPAAASYNRQMGEFLLLYDDVRLSPSPRKNVLEFCQSTYEAAADLGNWDRQALERAK
ncbi:MAG TPA: DUF5996 family protein [Candidatus Dormibacteraeota bacterium]|nr:DUF5996 family protein [Candidatus Dormibacteraeota bacterium]